MARYRWDFPHEWLLEKAQEYSISGNTAELLSIIQTLVHKLDSDQIQDDFEREMDADGYFVDLDAPVEEEDETEVA